MINHQMLAVSGAVAVNCTLGMLYIREQSLYHEACAVSHRFLLWFLALLQKQLC